MTGDVRDTHVDAVVGEASQMIARGDPKRAEVRLREVLARGLPVGPRLRVMELLAESLQVQGRLTTAVLSDLEDLAGSADVVSADAAAAFARASRGWAQIHENPRAQAAAERALRLAGPDPATRCEALTALSAPLFDEARVGEAEELTRAACELADTHEDAALWRSQPHFFHGICLMWLDRFDEARAVWLRGEELAVAAGHTTGLPLYFLIRGAQHLWEGRLDDAEVELETGLRLNDEVGGVVYRVLLEVGLARVKLHRTAFRDAGALLAAAEAEARDADHRQDAAGQVLHLRADIAEAEGSLDTALACLLRAAELGARNRRVETLALGARIARCAALLGDVALARSWAEEVARSAQVLGTASARGLMLQAAGWAGQDATVMRAALESLEGSPYVVAVARCCEDLAFLLDDDTAVPPLRRALESYQRMGATRDRARVLAALRRRGVRVGVGGPRKRARFGPASLTDTERQIADLMMGGLTYKEIGTRLFISSRTVETHVAHLFQKLGIAARKDLAGALEHGAG